MNIFDGMGSLDQNSDSFSQFKKPVRTPNITYTPSPTNMFNGYGNQVGQEGSTMAQPNIQTTTPREYGMARGFEGNTDETQGYLYQGVKTLEPIMPYVNQGWQNAVDTGPKIKEAFGSMAQQVGNPTVMSTQDVLAKMQKIRATQPNITDDQMKRAFQYLKENQNVQFSDSITDNPWIHNPTGALTRSILGGAINTIGQVAGGAPEAIGNLALGAGRMEAGDTAGAGQFAKGTTQGVMTGLNAIAPIVSTAFNSSVGQAIADPIFKPIGQGSEYLTNQALKQTNIDPNSQEYKDWQEAGSSAGQLIGGGLLFKGAEKVLPYVKSGAEYVGEKAQPIVTKVGEGINSIKEGISKNNENKAKALGDQGVEEIYQAVNPTTRENKAVLRQRVNDLLPYIDETSRFGNELPKVLERVDAEMQTAFRGMEEYENTVGVKGTVETKPIVDALKEKYQEKIGDSYLNPDEAQAAQKVIDLLDGFGSKLVDSDILKVRRAWDDIIKKNKGFMQSAEANIKGEVFNESNKFLRDEIRKSNPEYAKFLDTAHKTIILSDVLDATIQRRTGQSQGGVLRQGIEGTAKVAGAGLGSAVGTMIGGPVGSALGAGVGYGATEALLKGTRKFTGSSAKLARGKNLILKSQENGSNTSNPSNTSNSRVRNVQSNTSERTSGSGLKKDLIQSNIPGSRKTNVETAKTGKKGSSGKANLGQKNMSND